MLFKAHLRALFFLSLICVAPTSKAGLLDFLDKTFENNIVTLNAESITNPDGRFVGSYANFISRRMPNSTVKYQYFSGGKTDQGKCFNDVNGVSIPRSAACGSIYMYEGTSIKNAGATTARGFLLIPRSKINDVYSPSDRTKLDPDRLFTRMAFNFSKKDNRYYGVAFVSAGYSKDGRVYPAFISSKVGSTGANPADWTYHGRFGGEVGQLYGNKASWTSGMGFLVNDAATTALDHKNPMNNKFVLYNEFSRLNIVYSANGKDWYFYRNAARAIVDVRPALYADEAFIFTSVVKTPYGYFMYKTGQWGTFKHRMLYSANGLTWKVIGAGGSATVKAKEESRVGDIKKPKNINLAYDEFTKRVYLLITDDKDDTYVKRLTSFVPKAY